MKSRTRKHAPKALAAEIAAMVERAKLHSTCVTCCHFDEGSEGCALASGARPPARVIAMGCKFYTEEPPF